MGPGFGEAHCEMGPVEAILDWAPLGHVWALLGHVWESTRAGLPCAAAWRGRSPEVPAAVRSRIRIGSVESITYRRRPTSASHHPAGPAHPNTPRTLTLRGMRAAPLP